MSTCNKQGCMCDLSAFGMIYGGPSTPVAEAFRIHITAHLASGHSKER